MNLDSYASSHPISQPVDHPKQIKEIFDAITYSKVRNKLVSRNGICLQANMAECFLFVTWYVITEKKLVGFSRR